MATIKKRLNITLSREVGKALTDISKRDRVPRARKAAELLATALMLEEDVYFGVIAEARDKTPRSQFLSHEKVWKKFE